MKRLIAAILILAACGTGTAQTGDDEILRRVMEAAAAANAAHAEFEAATLAAIRAGIHIREQSPSCYYKVYDEAFGGMRDRGPDDPCYLVISAERSVEIPLPQVGVYSIMEDTTTLRTLGTAEIAADAIGVSVVELTADQCGILGGGWRWMDVGLVGEPAQFQCVFLGPSQ